ncbi:N-alpha-acetyltransferase 16, NatA auxiliary subunit [Balamuthia mandrillaris]
MAHSILCTELYGKNMSQPLPSKELNQFIQIRKLLDTKQYKKALKTCDAVLKKVGDHGETLALKGFIIRSQNPDKKDESYELMKKAVEVDPKGYVCWHLYGILCKADRDYAEAAKCFRNALKHDEKNNNLLRELAHLLIQIRDTSGYLEVRRKLLTEKPNNRNNWLAFAIAQYLCKDYAMALNVLTKYEETNAQQGDTNASEPFEKSELLLFKNAALEQTGDLAKTLEHLKEIEPHVLDKVTVQEKRASLLLRLGRLTEAAEQYRALLALNPEHADYHTEFRKASGLADATLSPEQHDQLYKLYLDLSKQFPLATAPRRIPLDFLEGKAFTTELENYIRPRLSKGKPSLFSELKSVYQRPGKAEVIERVLLDYYENLTSVKKFRPEDAKEQSPSTLLFVLLFLAYHFDAMGDHEKAFKFVDEGIAHTPTLINLYLCKGRIYKHAGDLVKASEMFEKARNLDLADRYLNTKSTRYLLRADIRDQADTVAGLFSRDGTTPQTNIYDMQCSWYEQELGESHYRSRDILNALKQFIAVEKHFNDFREDQYDFHSYCLRKMTLRSYLDLLEWEDRLHSHPFFVTTCQSIIKCHLYLHDHPEAVEAGTAAIAASKAEAAAADKPQTSSGSSETTQNPYEFPELADHFKDPLTQAQKYIKYLREARPEDLQTHLLSFQVFFKKEKYLMAIQPLRKAIQLAPDHPQVHRCLVTFFHQISKIGTGLDPLSTKVITQERVNLLGGDASLSPEGLIPLLQAANEKFKEAHPSLSHRVVAAEMQYLIGYNKEEASQVIANADLERASLQDHIAAHNVLSNVIGGAEAAEAWKQKSKQRFSHATYFADPQQQQ